MEENTTTDDAILLDDDGAEEAQPVVEEAQPAAQEPAEPTQTEDAEPSTDDDNLAWLQKKGIDPNSPEAVSKLADMYRNAEKAMHQSTQKASELEKTLSQGVAQDIEAAVADGNTELVDQLAAEVQGLKLAQNVNTFFTSNPEAKALEGKMTEIVTQRPEIGTLVKTGYLSLPDLYNLARGSDAGRDEELKSQGGKEALQKVATKQQAKAVVGNATTSQITPPEEDEFLKGFDSDS